jgi:hypothetical protein
MVLTEGHVEPRALVLAVLNLLIVVTSSVYLERAHDILLTCRCLVNIYRCPFETIKDCSVDSCKLNYKYLAVVPGRKKN